jgi:hypothetical protein
MPQGRLFHKRFIRPPDLGAEAGKSLARRIEMRLPQVRGRTNPPHGDAATTGEEQGYDGYTRDWGVGLNKL